MPRFFWFLTDHWFLELAFYALTLFGLLAALRRQVHQRRADLDAWVSAFSTDEPLQRWPTDQAWRKPTGIQFLEDLKESLVLLEERLVAERKAAHTFRDRRQELLELDANWLRKSWLDIVTLKNSRRGPMPGAVPGSAFN